MPSNTKLATALVWLNVFAKESSRVYSVSIGQDKLANTVVLYAPCRVTGEKESIKEDEKHQVMIV